MPPRSPKGRRPPAAAPEPVPGPVTALREHRRNAGRFVVEVAEVTVGAVPAETIAELGLRPGAQVDEALLARLLAAVRLTACYDKALEALARRSRSSAELERWLRARDFTAEEVEPAIARLTELALLDDLAFARSFARSRAAGKGFGRRRIASELSRKGVPRSVVDEVLAELAEEMDASEPDAMAAAAARRANSLRSLEPAVAQRRLFAWLVRRGYDARAARDLARKEFPAAWGGATRRDRE